MSSEKTTGRPRELDVESAATEEESASEKNVKALAWVLTEMWTRGRNQFKAAGVKSSRVVAYVLD
jgi:hypothetical protein